jgi:hypothetical protein
LRWQRGCFQSSAQAEGPEHLEEAEPPGQLEQIKLVDLVKRGRGHEAFELAFEHGDEMFETVFTAAGG